MAESEKPIGLFHWKRSPTFYETFMEEQGIPIVRGIGLYDSREVTLALWKGMGGAGRLHPVGWHRQKREIEAKKQTFLIQLSSTYDLSNPNLGGAAMPLDSQSRAVLDQILAFGTPPRNTVMPVVARRNHEMEMPHDQGPEVAQVEDRLIPGPGGDIWVRIYTPATGGPFPALVWFHGGGWYVGSIEMADGNARRLAVGADCVVVSVDYRLAPENKFPAAAEDCYAATAWVAKNAGEINADPRRIAVGGDSSGGNLAAVIALMARDRGEPPLVFQLLVYPVIQHKFDTKSYEENAVSYRPTRESMIYLWKAYLSDVSDAANPYAAPMEAKDLSGLPPALVITAEYDPLRDEGKAYAERLTQAGVPTTYTCYQGTMHYFFKSPGLIDQGKEATAQACASLRRAFAH